MSLFVTIQVRKGRLVSYVVCESVSLDLGCEYEILIFLDILGRNISLCFEAGWLDCLHFTVIISSLSSSPFCLAQSDCYPLLDKYRASSVWWTPYGGHKTFSLRNQISWRKWKCKHEKRGGKTKSKAKLFQFIYFGWTWQSLMLRVFLSFKSLIHSKNTWNFMRRGQVFFFYCRMKISNNSESGGGFAGLID